MYKALALRLKQLIELFEKETGKDAAYMNPYELLEWIKAWPERRSDNEH